MGLAGLYNRRLPFTMAATRFVNECQLPN